MIQKNNNLNTNHALNGTTAMHMAALLKGANILRVHDVMEAIECVKMWQNLRITHLFHS
jgi:dihydropteroate synthase